MSPEDINNKYHLWHYIRNRDHKLKDGKNAKYQQCNNEKKLGFVPKKCTFLIQLIY